MPVTYWHRLITIDGKAPLPRLSPLLGKIRLEASTALFDAVSIPFGRTCGPRPNMLTAHCSHVVGSLPSMYVPGKDTDVLSS